MFVAFFRPDHVARLMSVCSLIMCQIFFRQFPQWGLLSNWASTDEMTSVSILRLKSQNAICVCKLNQILYFLKSQIPQHPRFVSRNVNNVCFSCDEQSSFVWGKKFIIVFFGSAPFTRAVYLEEEVCEGEFEVAAVILVWFTMLLSFHVTSSPWDGSHASVNTHTQTSSPTLPDQIQFLWHRHYVR